MTDRYAINLYNKINDVFDNYLKKILNLVKKNQSKLEFKEINKFKGINLEIPPSNFDSDLSTNICMILGKLNNLDPKKLAVLVTELITKNISDFKKTEIAGPGFINIYLSNEALVSIIKDTFNEGKHFAQLKQIFL